MAGRYIRTSICAGNTILVNETYPRREGKGFTRSRYTGTTPAAQQRYNEKVAARVLTGIINENFGPEDWHLVLTYKRECRPAAESVGEIMKKFLRQVRTVYKKEGITFKYILATAYGSKGGIHHHLIISGIDIRLIRPLWERYGSIRPTGLYDTGEYSSLAWYFIQQAKQGLDPADVLNCKKWSCSKNLKRPEKEAEVKEISAIKWREPPVPKKGYWIDPDSVDAGINEQTGIPYLFYIQIKIPEGITPMTPDGRLLRKDAAERFIRERAQEKIRKHWDKLCPYGEIVRRKE